MFNYAANITGNGLDDFGLGLNSRFISFMNLIVVGAALLLDRAVPLEEPTIGYFSEWALLYIDGQYIPLLLYLLHFGTDVFETAWNLDRCVLILACNVRLFQLAPEPPLTNLVHAKCCMDYNSHPLKSRCAGGLLYVVQEFFRFSPKRRGNDAFYTTIFD
ncbi:hypothetical protein V8V88_22535 [Paenibacillus phytohabitans]